MQEKNMGHICPIGRSGVKCSNARTTAYTLLHVHYDIIACDDNECHDHTITYLRI